MRWGALGPKAACVAFVCSGRCQLAWVRSEDEHPGVERRAQGNLKQKVFIFSKPV